MKIIISILLIFLINECTAQLDSAEIVNNKLTELHQEINGTTLSIVPPNGWTNAINFNGFQQEKTGASIMAIEFPASFNVITEGFSKEKLLTQGVILEKKEQLNFNGSQAIVIYGEQFSQEILFEKIILTFGNENKTTMILGAYPKELSKELKAPIKSSILSIVDDSKRTIDPLENIQFALETDSTKLQLGKVVSNNIIYTVDGLVPTKSQDKTTLIAGTSLQKVLIEDRKKYALDRVKDYPLTSETKIDTIYTIEIDSISGYTVMAYGIDEKTKKSKLIFQTILFSDHLYYLIVGMAKDDFEENLKMFENITQSFKRK